MNQMTKILVNETETAAFATAFADAMHKNNGLAAKLYLYGNLGAGKTTFSRYFIQAFGMEGPVKSPTYTLIEPYEFEAFTLLHCDLYRLASPLEIYDLGLLEEESAMWLIEWPEKGEGVLPKSDLNLRLNRTGETLTLELEAVSALGEAILAEL